MDTKTRKKSVIYTVPETFFLSQLQLEAFVKRFHLALFKTYTATHNVNARIDSTRTVSADGSNATIYNLQSFLTEEEEPYAHQTFGRSLRRKMAGKDLLFIFGSHFSFGLHNIKPEFDIKTNNLI